MNKELKNEIEKKIANQGYQKKFVAQRIGLDPVRFSQTMAGKRKLTIDEFSGLKNLLGLTCKL